VLVGALAVPVPCSTQAKVSAQNSDTGRFSIDYSGVELFWKTYDVLSQDREPTPALWDELFSNPGYAALERKEHKRSVLNEAFRIAYKPSYKERIAPALERGDFTSQIIPHLLDVPSKKRLLDNYLASLRDTRWLSRALDRTQTLMPEGLTRQHAPPPISFIIFAPDARGYADIVVVDLLALEKNFDPEGFLAHEFFHYYRRFFATRYSTTTDKEPLLNVLENAQEEGTADQLDKRRVPFLSEEELKSLVPNDGDRSFFDDYRRAYANANYWLGRVESVLQDHASGSKEAPDSARSLKKAIPIDGRPLGAFMARTIQDVLGLQKLASVSGDALSFWLLYNEAARKSSGRARVLSQPAIEMISRLRADSK